MDYREVSPHPALRPYVACYWQIRRRVGPGRRETHRVLPDGCADLLFELGDPARLTGRGPARPAASRLVGTMQRALVIEYSGALDVFGVRFRPGGALGFFGFPLAEITDAQIAAVDAPSTRMFRVEEELFGAPGFEQRAAIVERVLLRRLEDVAPVDRALTQVLALIRERRGRVRIGRLAQAAELGERQLERRFRDQTGLSPKAFCRFARWENALGLLLSPGAVSGAEIALGAGYFDQAHFLRDFKRFTGLSPSRYRTERADVGFVQYESSW